MDIYVHVTEESKLIAVRRFEGKIDETGARGDEKMVQNRFCSPNIKAL